MPLAAPVGGDSSHRASSPDTDAFASRLLSPADACFVLACMEMPTIVAHLARCDGDGQGARTRTMSIAASLCYTLHDRPSKRMSPAASIAHCALFLLLG